MKKAIQNAVMELNLINMHFNLRMKYSVIVLMNYHMARCCEDLNKIN